MKKPKPDSFDYFYDLCVFDTSSFNKSIIWMILYKIYCVN